MVYLLQVKEMNKKEVMHMQNVIHALLSTIFISLPEEIFATCIILILFKRFDLLDIRMWRYNIKWILIPSLSMSICINFFKYIIIIPKLLTTIISLIVFCVAIYFIIKNLSIAPEKKLIVKTIIYSIIVFIIIILIELLYIPLTFSLLKITYNFFNEDILYMFLLAVPSRILEFSLVTFFIVKVNEQVNVKLYEIVFKNKTLTNLIIFVIIFLIFFLIYIVKLISYNNILVTSNLSILEQVSIIGWCLSLPTVFLMILWYMINYIVGIEKRVHQMYDNLND